MRSTKTANNLSEKSNKSEVYLQSELNDLSGPKVLSAIADDKSWILFRTIAMSSDSNGQLGDESQILLSKLNLTHSQYYQRINRLTSSGLINRKNGRYGLSSFGKIIYEIQKTIETAIQYRWRFVAIDSLESSPSAEGVSIQNKIKIINALLGDYDEIKNMLLCEDGSSNGDLIKVPPP